MQFDKYRNAAVVERLRQQRFTSEEIDWSGTDDKCRFVLLITSIRWHQYFNLTPMAEAGRSGPVLRGSMEQDNSIACLNCEY
jgi:hypothetical protein